MLILHQAQVNASLQRLRVSEVDAVFGTYPSSWHLSEIISNVMG